MHTDCHLHNRGPGEGGGMSFSMGTGGQGQLFCLFFKWE